MDWRHKKFHFMIALGIVLAPFAPRVASRALAEGKSALPKPSKPDRAATARAMEAYGRLPLSFEINRGQTDPQVKFFARGRGYTLFLTSDEAVLTLKKPAPRAPAMAD